MGRHGEGMDENLTYSADAHQDNDCKTLIEAAYFMALWLRELHVEDDRTKAMEFWRAWLDGRWSQAVDIMTREHICVRLQDLQLQLNMND